MRASWWTALIAGTLLLGACGGSGAGDAGGDGASTSSSAPGRPMNGSVCSLLTAAEVEAAVKSGQTLTATESGGGKDEDRTCGYVMQGVGAPVLVISLQGERERLTSSPNDLRAAYPRAVAVQVRGADALQLDPSGPTFVVQKNGLMAYVQPVIWPQTETTLSVATKLAQPIADRLP